MRGMATLMALGLLAQGCIIYEEHYDGDTGNCPPDLSDDRDPDQIPGTDDTDDEMVVLDLYLSDADGEQGEILLTTLLSDDPELDLRSITDVAFARDVEVNDAMVREDEVVLLLAVGADADPGLVDGYVLLNDGTQALIAEPFEILEAADGLVDGPDSSGDTGQGSAGGTDTGSSTGGNGSNGGTDTGSSTGGNGTNGGGTDTGSSTGGNGGGNDTGSGATCQPGGGTTDTGCP